MKFITTKDQMVRMTMQAIARRAESLDQDLGERRAVQIANAVGKMLGG